MTNFNVGDIIQFSDASGASKSLKDYYGLIYNVRPGFYNAKVIYYDVCWFDTGDSFSYEESEIEKVTL